MDRLNLWRRYKETRCTLGDLGITLDVSRMRFPDGFFASMEPAIQAAYEDMRHLEAGDIANPDEQRMVGHYWLRAPHLAPEPDIADAIETAHRDVYTFAQKIHDKEITPPGAARFSDLLLIGIGGSALGPQLIADALGGAGGKRDKMAVHFLDNTDPDGVDRVLAELGARLKSTLVLVVSKSGGTKETRNGMIEVRQQFDAAGLDFPRHAVAITGENSALDQLAQSEQWLARFPMWDWVGGRTSVTSTVGMVPAALQGLDINALLDGAAEMDKLTRVPDTKANPAARLALMWHYATGGKGERDMVVLPYKDRLLLLSRYLQQLVMESLGKSTTLDGQPAAQGITVYGNKGSTDQHAYVQQLRDGVNNFFVNFIVALEDRPRHVARKRGEVEPGVTSGDYLYGFWHGTRDALFEQGRESITISVERIDARTLGALIALYERAVGLYASLVNINAYHQPGVEAGKKAAEELLDLQKLLVDYMQAHPDAASPEQVADRMERPHDVEAIAHLLEHLAANKRGVAKVRGKFRWKG